jgi:putative N-acetylmannosamine-6-phosphate epimerase
VATKLKIASDSIAQLRGGLIVSSQASDGEPLCAPEHIAAMALSAVAGGAKGLRLEGAENVEHLRPRTKLPIIALTKDKDVPEKERNKVVYITSTFDDAASLARAGADIIAVDATARPRRSGITLVELIKRIHDELKKPVWADVALIEEGLAAFEAGADIVSTTLSGYTTATASRHGRGPDMTLLRELIVAVSIPVVLEGQVWHPEEVTRAFKEGAYAVVVGSAITRPQLITRRFVDAIPHQE